MNENDFIRQQQAAVERMREMNSRSIYDTGNHHMPPVPPFVRVPYSANTPQGGIPQDNPQHNPHKPSGKPSSAKTDGTHSGKKPDRAASEAEKSRDTVKDGAFLGGLNLPFLDLFKKDGDMTLIIGLLLILLSEKTDKKLLFALIYILL